MCTIANHPVTNFIVSSDINKQSLNIIIMCVGVCVFCQHTGFHFEVANCLTDLQIKSANEVPAREPFDICNEILL